jgi:hypothetical protein
MVGGGWQPRVMGAQAAYYLLTGLWPIFHLDSFEAITGPKVDDWLVRMVGLLAAAIGGTLAIAVARGRSRALELVALAVASALAFTLIDLWYGLSGRISPIYLVDAALELGLILLLLLTHRAARRDS